MTQPDPKLVEAPITLAESKLWSIQRNFFLQKGISAWDKDVPSYITSNAYIGRLYAEQCVAFIQDWCNKNPNSDRHFYFLEIASGTGMFAFYFLQAINSLLTQLTLKNVKISYIISDLIESNIQFCESNPVFRPYIAADQLFFAVFDGENGHDIVLRNSTKKLSHLIKETPLLMIANYAFDCIQQDIFKISDEGVENVLVGIKSRYKDYNTEKVEHVNELHLNFQSARINPQHYYQDPTINKILQNYIEAFDELVEQDKKSVNLYMPLGGMNVFKTIDHISKGRYFALIGDKGLSTINEMLNVPQETFCTFDGIYTFFVNFDALKMYTELLQGDAILSPAGPRFKVNLFFKGIDKADLIHTKSVLQDRLEKLSPENFCAIYDDYFAYAYRFNYGSLIGLLRLSEWDPIIYIAIHERIIELVPNLTTINVDDLLNNIDRVIKNIYPITHHERAFVMIGWLYEKLKKDDRALEIFLEGLHYFPKSKSLNQACAMMYEKLKNPSKAINYYQNVLTLNSHDVFAKKRLQALTGKFTFNTMMPFLRGLFVFLCVGASLYLLTK